MEPSSQLGGSFNEKGAIMRYEDMTSRQKSKVRFDICPLCSGKFNKLDDIQEIKMKYGRTMMHFYFHSSCLVAWRYTSQLEGVENEKATV